MKKKIITFFLILSIVVFILMTIVTTYVVVKSFTINYENSIDGESGNDRTFIQKVAEETFLQKTMIGAILLFLAITFIIINELKTHLRKK